MANESRRERVSRLFEKIWSMLGEEDQVLFAELIEEHNKTYEHLQLKDQMFHDILIRYACKVPVGAKFTKEDLRAHVFDRG